MNSKFLDDDYSGHVVSLVRVSVFRRFQCANAGFSGNCSFSRSRFKNNNSKMVFMSFNLFCFFVHYNTLLPQGRNGVSHDFLFFVVIFVVPID